MRDEMRNLHFSIIYMKLTWCVYEKIVLNVLCCMVMLFSILLLVDNHRIQCLRVQYVNNVLSV